MERPECALVTITLLMVTVASSRLFEDDVCRTSDGLSGVCKSIYACPSALNDFYKGKVPTICSYDRWMPVVCCPSTATVPPATPKPTTTSTAKPVPKPTTTSATTVDQQDGRVGQKAKKMCLKYSEAVWHEESEPTLFLDVDDETPPRYNKSDCGVLDSAELIIGGDPAAPKEFPHMAVIGYGDAKTIKWGCGGSLISERFILTAAHCVISTNYGLAKWVRLGDLNLANPDDGFPQQFLVTRRFRHPNYTVVSHYEDIALLRLNDSVKLNAYVRPACLNVDRIIAQKYFQASGWGRVEWNNDENSDELMKVTLPATSASNCTRAYRPVAGTKKLMFGVDDNKMVCAGEDGKDTCLGDSGGPLQIVLKEPYCMYSIVGVTSFGLRCGAENSPAVYTRVSNYIEWIESVVWR